MIVPAHRILYVILSIYLFHVCSRKKQKKRSFLNIKLACMLLVFA
ncbi:hypothetical protein SPAB_03669 [Salmonella enterica subsp. enterica serovar Paratyphi B str. SPB7]|uniref:Uncharacterized protein n=1 Tax=Salmonella paratyphi B (strain ATCC BAA-1250 / SPB7) TaxID=1016998 RepID=A0A6C6Z6G3_SALPB|nr:hypothetical protein SPAB_03669 [Salmonella enterica subsp. enterica serovar Paratyphi B str. SPB7]